MPTEDERAHYGRGEDSIASRAEEMRGGAMRRGLLVGMGLAFAIGWIPLAGPFAAGFAGGMATRSRIQGIYSVFLPGTVCVGWGWFFNYILPAFAGSYAETVDTLNRIVTGGNALIFAFLITGQFIACVLGGWFGGAWVERREGRGSEQWPRPV